MTHEFKMHDHFGSFLADGDVANSFRFCEVEPKFATCSTIIFDFTNVDNMTDSFANACFGTLAEDHPVEISEKVRFRNCSQLIHDFLASAVSFGRRKGLQAH